MVLLQKEIKTRVNYREQQMEFTKSLEWLCDKMSDKLRVV